MVPTSLWASAGAVLAAEADGAARASQRFDLRSLVLRRVASTATEDGSQSSTAAQTPPPAGHRAGEPDEKAALLEQQLDQEIQRLKRLEEELRIIKAAPPPPKPAPAVEAKVKPPSLDEVPDEPVAGAEEAFADALYVLGKYDQARQVYRHLIQQNPSVDTVGWACLQVGNCARKKKEFMAAIAAYEECMNRFAESPWAKEAAWWSGHLKWMILLKETMRQESAASAVRNP